MNTLLKMHVSLAVLLELLTRTELKTGHEFLSMMWNSVEVSMSHSYTSHELEETCLQVCTIVISILNSFLLVCIFQRLTGGQHLIDRNNDGLLVDG